MISQAVFRRIFHIAIGERKATAFSFEVEGRQYLATAKHILGNLTHIENIAFRTGKEWELFPITMIGIGSDKVDVFVFAIEQPLPAEQDWLSRDTEYFVSQDVFFLGYPLGLGEPAVGELLPLAFVKKACVSALGGVNGGDVGQIFLDGINNQGFSGGPVVALSANNPKTAPKVIGLISSYKDTRLKVVTESGETGFFVRENTGIIIAMKIEHAVSLVRANPVGFLLCKSIPATI